MGLREKVTLTVVIIIIIQIACRHCMPRTSSKSAYKHYLNLKSIKNKSSTPFSPSRVNKTPNPTFGKKSQNAKIRQNPPTKKSMYEAYNFPETEYPLDNSPSDSIYFGTNFNKKNQFITHQKESRNLKKSAIDSMKRDIKMRRKLTSNKKNHMESPKKDMSSVTTFASGPASIRLMETGTFPEVQYPLNAMETWAPNYWYPLPFTQEEQKYDIGGLQPLKSKVNEDGKTPFVKVTKAKANKYLQYYDKLKDEQSRTSSLSSKRSNSGNTAFNFVKTATSEKHSDDFISSSMISSIPNNSSDTKKTVMQKTEIPLSSDNICPVIEYDYELVPIPYKVIEQDTENVCPAYELNSTKINVLNTENQTMRATINKTQLVHTNTLTDDIRSTGSKTVSQEVVSTATDKILQQQKMEINIPEYTSTNGPSKEVTLTPIDSVNNFSDEPIVEPPTPVSDDTLSDFLQNDMLVSTVHENSENTLNAIPSPLTGPIPEIFPINVSSPQTIAPLSNHNTVSSTSIIIIPINNADGKSQPHIIETVGDAPIILYIPGSHNEHTTKSVHNHQPLTLVKSISNNLDSNISDVGIPEVPNNTTSISYDMITRFNENPSQSALINKIPLIEGTSCKHFSNTESQFLKYETLPINSMCYNNENNPLSLRKEPPFNKSMLDTSPDSPSDKSKFEDSNFEFPLFNFTGSDSTLPSTQSTDTTIENVPIPMDRNTFSSPLPVTLTECLPLPIDKILAYKPISDSTTNKPPMVDKTISTLISDPPNIQASPIEKTIPPTLVANPSIDVILPPDKTLISTPFFDTTTDTVALPIDKTFPPTPLPETPIDGAISSTLISDPPYIVTTPVEMTFPPTPHSDFPTDEPLLLDKSLTPTPLLDNSTESLPPLLDKTLPLSPFSGTPTARPLMPDKTLSPTPISDSPNVLASSIEKIVPSTPLSEFPTDGPGGPVPFDKMLTSTPHFDPPTVTLPLPMDKTLSGPTPLLETPIDRLPILAKTHPPTPISYSSSIPPSPIEKTVLPTPLSDFPTDRPLSLDKTIASTPVLDSPTDTLPLPMDKTLSPTPLSETPTDRLSILDKTYPPTPISDSPSMLPSPIKKTVPPTPLSALRTDGPLTLNKTLTSTLLYDTPTDGLPLSIDKTLPPTPLSETLTDRPPMLEATLAPTLISDTHSILPPPIEKSVPPTPPSNQLTIGSLPLHKIRTSVLLTDTPSDNLPVSIDKTLPATALSEAPTNKPPMLEETLAPTPISIPPRILQSPIENTIPPAPLTALSTDRPIPLDMTAPSTPLIEPRTDTLPLLIDKTHPSTPLSETPTDRMLILSKTYPPTLISNAPSILPSPIEKTVPPTPLSDFSTDRPLPLDKTIASTPVLDSPTDNLPISIDKTLLATALSETLTDRPPMLEETLTPTPISNLPSILSSPLENTIPRTMLTALTTDGPLPQDNTILFTPLLDPPTDTLPLLIDKTLPLTPLSETLTDRLPRLNKTYPPISISDSTSILRSPIESIVPPTLLSDIPTGGPVPLDKTLTSTPLLETPSDDLPLSIDKTIPSTPLSESPTYRPPMLEETLAPTPIFDPPRILQSPIDNTIPPTPTPLTDLSTGGPLRLDMSTPSTPLFDPPTDPLSLLIDKTHPPTPLTEIPTDRLPILGKTYPPTPISDSPSMLPSPIENTVPPTPLSDFSTDRPLLLDKTIASATVFDSPTHNLPLSIDKKLPATALSETLTDRSPMLEETLTPTPISDLPTILPSSLENTIPPTLLSALTTDGPLPLDNTILFTPLLDTSTESLPLLVNKTLPPTPLSESPTDRLSRLNKTYPSISISDSPRILQSPSIVPPTPLSDIPTGRPLPLEKTLTYTPLLDTPSANLPLSIDKIIPSTPFSESPTYRPPMLEETLAPTPISDPPSILSSLIENIIPPTPRTNLPTDGTLPLDKTIPTTPLLDSPTDTLSLLIDKTLQTTSLTEIPTDRLPILGKTYPSPPISDSPSMLPSPIENTVPPTPLSDFSTDRPLPLDKTIASAPVFDSPTHNLPLSIDKKLPATALSETLTDRPPMLGETLALTLTSDLPSMLPSSLENTIPPTPLTDHPTDGPLPLDKTIPSTSLLDSPTESLPMLVNKTLPPTPPSDTPTDRLPILDKSYPPTPISNNSSPVENTVPPMPLPDFPTNRTLPLDKTLTSGPLLDPTTDTLSLPMNKMLPPTLLSETPTNLPSMLDETLSPIPISFPSNILPSTMEKTPSPFSDPARMENTLPSSPLLETPSDRLPMLDKTQRNLTPPINKVLPDIQFTDLGSNELALLNYDLPLPVDKDTTLPDMQKFDNSLPLSADRLPTDIPSDNLLLPVQSGLSHNPTDSISLLLDIGLDTPESSILSVDKVLSGSKLPITKALLENVFSEITQGGLTLLEEKNPLDSSLALFTIKLPMDVTLVNEPFSGITSDCVQIPLEYSLSELPLSDMTEKSLPLPVCEILTDTILSDKTVDNLPISRFEDNYMPLPEFEIPTDALPSPKEIMRHMIDDDLPHLFVVDKTPPETDYFDFSFSDLSSPINLPPPINKTLPDIQFTDLVSNYLVLLNFDLPLPVDKDTTLSDMQKLDNSLPLSADRLPTDIPSDHLLLPVQSGVSHNPTDSIPLSLDIGLDAPESSILSVDKVLSSSKLPITKALLENVFSEITQGGLTMLEGKNPPSSSLALFKKLPIDMTLVNEPFSDTTSDCLQIPLEHSLSELPLSDMTEKSLPLPVCEILTDTILSDKTVDNLPISRFAENYLLLPEFEIPIDELPSPIEIMRPDLPNILTSDDKKVKKAPFSANPTNDMPLLLHKKLSPLQITTDSPQLAINKELSASELSVTKALLENVLSDFIKIVVSLPEEKSVSVSSLSKLLTKDLPSNKKLPDYLFPEIAGKLPILLEPILSDNSTNNQLMVSDKAPLFLDNSSDYLSLPTENEVPLSNNSPDSHYLAKATAHTTKSQITKALLENVLSEISKGGLSVPKSPITSLSKISSKDLQEVKPKFNDLPLSMDNPFQENKVPDTIKDNAGLSKDTIIQMNPLSNNFTDSLPSTGTLLPDNGLSETTTDNLDQ